MFYQKRRYDLTKTEVRLKQVDKNILRLVYGISIMSLHLHYYPADGGGSFGEGGREDLGEEVEGNKVIELKVEPQKKKQKRELQRFLFEALSY